MEIDTTALPKRPKFKDLVPVYNLKNAQDLALF